MSSAVFDPIAAAAAPAGTSAPAGQAPFATVLCVDDEANILSALKRMLRGGGHCVLTASSAAVALTMLDQMPVDLVISDMRMPGMDGAQLLEQVHLRWPHVVRILLTGQADMGSTVAAINRGRIFRFVHKPWDDHDLLGAVQQGLQLQALQREKDRLEALTQAQNHELKQLNADLEARVGVRTAELAAANDKLRGNYLKSVKVFANLLELRGAAFAGHGRRVGQLARDIARKMALPEQEVLRVFVGGMLHDIGLIGACDRLVNRPVARFSDEELALYRQHPLQAETTLMALDDMQPLMPIIRGHHERWDGSGFPDRLAGETIPIGARIVAVADAFDYLQHGIMTDAHLSAQEARILMGHGRGSQFDPQIIEVFLQLTEPQQPKPALPTTRSAALEPGMVLATDLVSFQGLLLLTAGHVLTVSLIQHLREYERRERNRLEIHVRPMPPAAAA
jgi:response regulator RpfG family c-di-GMP phosphodiesterase